MTVEHLTNREVELLALNLNGLSAKQLGAIFSISYRTVQTHLYSAIHKFGCQSRIECFEKLYQQGSWHLWVDFAKILLEKDNPLKRGASPSIRATCFS